MHFYCDFKPIICVNMDELLCNKMLANISGYWHGFPVREFRVPL